jgi:predicted RND superfamily exporter protein
MYSLGVPLNPMTQILGVIVIGTVTEYTVIILNRYRQEKALGEPPAEAMATAVSRVGRAVIASAATTLGGFAVLIASDFVMLRDFGIATVIGIVLCIISAMMVMPPLIVWLDERRSGIRFRLRL